MNVDDERVRTMAEWAKHDGRDVWERRFLATDVKADFQGLEFTCNFGKEKVRVKAPVIGAHQVNNILLAVSGAMAAGMTFKEAAKAACGIRLNPKSLSAIPGINGSVYINDTFNNSPDSAKAALDVLALAKGKKFLVFQPMIELGAYASSSHREVGAYAARICDEIFLTNRNFYEVFMEGVTKTVSVSVLAPDKAAMLLKSKLGKGDAVLFKGKEAEHVLNAIT